MDSLPEELFIQIILHVIGIRDQANGRSCLIQVSQAWKRAIEGCSLFWTEAIVHGGRVPLQEVLSRGLRGPLDVILDIRFPNVADEETLAQLALVSEHSSRWRSLSIQGVLTDDVIVHFAKPASKLESIFIAAYMGGFEYVQSVELGETGNLHELHLASVGMNWNSPRLPGLKALRLHSLSRNQTPSLEQLAACLRASPELRVLVLANLAGSEASPTTRPEEIAFQFLSLTTLALYDIPKDILEFAVFAVEAPNCNSSTVWGLDVSVLQSTEMVGHLKSLLHRHISFTNTFTLRYTETGGGILFRDRDHFPPNGWVEVLDPEERSGILVGFRPSLNLFPGEETRQLLGNCYPRFCDVLVDVLVPQDAFDVTFLLEHQRRPGLDLNGLVSFHPYTLPLHLFSHLPFITRITTEGWHNWAPVLDYLSRPKRNPASGEKSWPCPNLKLVELQKDLIYVELWEVEEMDRSLDRFVTARSATTALENVKVADLGESCTHIWERGQGWSVLRWEPGNESR
ncbi:hypothetical protein M407DRAFT_28874 [Tulasnella calospora MUT 4182]|uniref:F-box domain-containing protein n=1 Tax=Tulasnella calospora MUT 4182 TaxID=1051891 RepID=A0A0C3QB73_9AGAM|nr:hypothetical protein M407DRAFT_28874 [Tulasnella calospora MUT 4182]